MGQFQDTGEVLGGQGEMATRVDTQRCGLVSSPLSAAAAPHHRFSVPHGALFGVGVLVVLGLD
jgi:hypothetical protein